jgi:hypothetical protein
MANFADGIIALQQMGVADVLLPFFLIFTVVFAVLNKTHILGAKADAKKYNIIVALVMGASVIFPHVLGVYPPQSDPVNIINSALPSISVVVIAIVMVMLLLGVFGADLNLAGTSVNAWILFICAGTVIYVFGTSAGYFGNGRFPAWLWFLADPNTQSLLVMVLVFGMIIWFVTKEDKEPKPGDRFRDWIHPLDRGDGKPPSH